MRTPGEIRSELDAACLKAWEMLNELPAECHRDGDTDLWEALKSRPCVVESENPKPEPQADLFEGLAA